MTSLTGIRKSKRRKNIRAILWRDQNGICPWCSLPLEQFRNGTVEGTLDHIIPKSHGGKLIQGNRQLLHEQCNQAKGNKCPGCLFCRPIRKETPVMEPASLTTYYKRPPRIRAIQILEGTVYDAVQLISAKQFISASTIPGEIHVAFETNSGKDHRIPEGGYLIIHPGGQLGAYDDAKTFREAYSPVEDEL